MKKTYAKAERRRHMDSKKIGAFLKNLRNEKGLTQEQLAEVLGVSGRTVSRWETGSNLPDLSMLIQIAEYYGVDIKDILDGEKESENMDKELKETLEKVADYNALEKKIVKQANGVAFSLIFSACAVAILIQLLATSDLIFVIGETVALIVGGIAYIGIMIHNGLWDMGMPWRNTWKSDLLVSVVCAFVFGLAYMLFLNRAGATYNTIVQWTVGFWIGITALAFIVLRTMAYRSKKMHQRKTDENGYRKNEEPAIVKVYNAKDIVTAQILKDLLKEENVEVFVQNSGSEVAGHSTPGFGIYGVDIYTTEDNAEKAVRIIRQYHDGISE
jgi:transcriptional regulator with XRE-family HTH domain